MRNTTYRVNVTQEGNSLTVDSVEKLRKFNQHRSEWQSVAKSTFSVSNKDASTLKFSKKRKRKENPPSVVVLITLLPPLERVGDFFCLRI